MENKKEPTSELSFIEQTINTLKEESKMLDKARKIALEHGQHSDFKLLINNYKQVLELIQTLEKDNKSNIQTVLNINSNWDSIKTVEGDNSLNDIVEKTLNAAIERIKKEGSYI